MYIYSIIITIGHSNSICVAKYMYLLSQDIHNFKSLEKKMFEKYLKNIC